LMKKSYIHRLPTNPRAGRKREKKASWTSPVQGGKNLPKGY